VPVGAKESTAAPTVPAPVPPAKPATGSAKGSGTAGGPPDEPNPTIPLP
jgi:hypothetical protein